MDKNDKGTLPKTEDQINAALSCVGATNIGMLDAEFLCHSVGLLDPPDPVTASENTTIHEIVLLLKKHHIGCLLITTESGKLCGIFGERDYMVKVYGTDIDVTHTPVSALMTRDPMTVMPDSTVAYVLNLMSQGGFRHVPIVDPDGFAVGVVSVRDIIDYIVEKFTEDVLGLEVEDV